MLFSYQRDEHGRASVGFRGSYGCLLWVLVILVVLSLIGSASYVTLQPQTVTITICAISAQPGSYQYFITDEYGAIYTANDAPGDTLTRGNTYQITTGRQPNEGYPSITSATFVSHSASC